VVDITPRPLNPAGKTNTEPIEQEAGWAPETVLTVWIGEIYLAVVGI